MRIFKIVSISLLLTLSQRGETAGLGGAIERAALAARRALPSVTMAAASLPRTTAPVRTLGGGFKLFSDPSTHVSVKPAPSLYDANPFDAAKALYASDHKGEQENGLHALISLATFPNKHQFPAVQYLLTIEANKTAYIAFSIPTRRHLSGALDDALGNISHDRTHPQRMDALDILARYPTKKPHIIRLLEDVINNSPPTQYFKAARIFAHLGEASRAMSILEGILKDPDTPHYDDARDLLAKLKYSPELLETLPEGH